MSGYELIEPSASKLKEREREREREGGDGGDGLIGSPSSILRKRQRKIE